MKNNLHFFDQIDQTLYTFNIISITITIVGLSYYMLNCYAIYYYLNQVSVRPIDATRVQEGLPTDVSLTAGDFENPEDLVALLREFGAPEEEENVNMALENNEHYVNIQNQIENENPLIRLHTAIENIITTINVEVNTMLENYYAADSADLLVSIQDLIMRFYTLIEAFIQSFFI